MVPMQKASFRPKHYGAQPYRIDYTGFRAFFSLSPVVFPHKDALEETLRQHMSQKKGKGSKANKRYELATTKYSDEMGAEQPRCVYEQCRLLMAGLSSSLFYSPLSYGLASPRPPSPMFLVLACNAYRLRDISDFLDMAWGTVDADSVRSQADLGALNVDLRQDMDFQNEMFAGGRTRQACQDGTTLKLADLEDERISLKPFIQSHLSSTNDETLIVLTYDWKSSKSFLNAIGVDTGSWRSNLDDLLRPKEVMNIKQESARRRSRSPGPRRVSTTQASFPAVTKRAVDTEFNIIRFLDVRELYGSAKRSGHLDTNLLEACKDFDMVETESIPPNTFCAGNELSLIWSLFKKMALGPSVDEMWTAQFKDKRISAYSDDEEDENEDGDGTLFSAPPPTQSGSSAQNSAPRNKDPFGLWDADEDRLLDD